MRENDNVNQGALALKKKYGEYLRSELSKAVSEIEWKVETGNMGLSICLSECIEILFSKY